MLAASGQRTLAFGLERGIGGALDAVLDAEPAEVSERLDALECNPGVNPEDEFRDWLHAVFDFRNMDADLAEDLSALPGINHIGRLLELEMLVSSEDYDAVVVDASTLSIFLDLPAALDACARWLDKLFARRQSSVFEPLVRAFASDYAERGDEVLDSGKEMLGRLASLRDLLTDPEVTTVRLIVPGNRSALREVGDALSVLSLFSYRTDAAIMGNLLPAAVQEPFFDGQRKEQKAALEALRKLTPAPPVMRAELQATAPRGPKALTAFTKAVYGESDPAGLLAPAEEHSVARESGHYLLRVHVPHARREELRLEELDDGIAVHLNGRRCVLTLPEDVHYRSASNWSYDDNVLTITLAR